MLARICGKNLLGFFGVIVFVILFSSHAFGEITIVVNSLADPLDNEIVLNDSIMTLREAILISNADATTETYHIIFDPSLSDPGTIFLSRPLPALTANGTIIEGLVNTIFEDLEQRLLIHLILVSTTSGVAVNPIITIKSRENVIKNLVFGGWKSTGVLITGQPDYAVFNLVTGCLFGMSALSPFPFEMKELEHGVYITDKASYNYIGDPVPFGGNAFFSCRDTGITIASPNCHHNIIRRNVIGCEVLNVGVRNGTGIRIRGTDNLVGGSQLSDANVIVENLLNGVLVDGIDAIRNTISHNAIYNNGRLGIDLSFIGGAGDGPNRFTVMGLQRGPNKLVPAPIMEHYSHQNLYNLHKFTVTGWSLPDSIIELYEAEIDPSGYGEGRRFLGTATADTDGHFEASFFLDPGKAITTLCTCYGNTSEFSQTVILNAVSGTQPILQIQAWQNLFHLPMGLNRWFGLNTNHRVPEDLTISFSFFPPDIATIINGIAIRHANFVIFPMIPEAPGGTFLKMSLPPEYGGASTHALVYVDHALDILYSGDSEYEMDDQLDGIIPFKYYKIYGTEGDIVNVTVESLNPDGTTIMDPVVYIFNERTRNLAYNNNYQGLNPYAQAMLPEFGDYYIAVGDLYLRSGAEYSYHMHAWIDSPAYDSPIDPDISTVPMDHRPKRLALGDLNNDGYDDMAVIFSNFQILSVLLKTPGQNLDFLDPINVPLNFQPESITIEDFDGNGWKDILTTNAATGEVLIQFNNGNFKAENAGGTLKKSFPTKSFKMAGGEGEGSAMDFNLDTFADYAFMSSTQAVLEVFLNDGQGNLSLNQTLSAGVYPLAMDVADFDGDGSFDIAIADNGADSIYIFEGEGNGHFNAVTTLETDASPTDLKASDLDNDGLSDIMVCTDSAGILHTFNALPSFEFQPYQEMITGESPNSIAIADLNADGLEDVAVSNSGSQDIYIYQGAQLGLLIPAAIISESGEIEELLWLSFGSGGGYIGIAPDEEFIAMLQGSYRILDFPISESTDTVSTAFALANPVDGDDAVVYFSLYDLDGCLVSDPDIENPVVVTIPGGQQIAFYVSDVFGDGLSAYSPWMRAVSLDPNLQGFYLLTSTSGGPFMDGAIAQGDPSTHQILPTNETITGDGDCYGTIVNPNDDAAQVVITCYGAEGQPLADEVRVDLNAGGRYVFSFKDIFPTVDVPCYLDVSATRPMDCFQYGGTVDCITATSGIPVTDPQKQESQIYAPHFAEGRLYRSILDLFNRSNDEAHVVVHAFEDDGTLLKSSDAILLAPNGMLRDELSNLLDIDWQSADYIVGFLRVESDKPGIYGTLTFGDRENVKFSSALTLQESGVQNMMFSHLAVGDLYETDYYTGVTILNAGAADVTVQVTVYDEYGQITGQDDALIPAGCKVSQMIQNFVPGLQPQIKGYITITTSDPSAELYAFELFGDSESNFMSAVPPQAFE